MDGINEHRPQQTNYVIFVRGSNFGFMHASSVQYVIDAILQSGIKLSVNNNNNNNRNSGSSSLQKDLQQYEYQKAQMKEHIQQFRRIHQCSYCSRSTLSGSTCCPTCKKPCCNQCWIDNVCPTCNRTNLSVKQISPNKFNTRFCSGIPSCPSTELKMKCGWCREVFYCSTKCRESHWNQHRQTQCKIIHCDLSKTFK